MLLIRIFHSTYSVSASCFLHSSESCWRSSQHPRRSTAWQPAVLLRTLKTVSSRITKFYGDIHTDIIYNHIGYDVIIYFQSEVIGETDENTASDDCGWNLSRTALHAYRGEAPTQTCRKWRHKLLAVDCKMLQKVRKTGSKCRIRRM